ncbi:MAG: hypothetical protein C0484_24825 [Rhodospirillum sp.]|nr:hypothetical protein [Rhodospirillum sp.]
MTGGLGNDTYIVDEAGDQIVDTGGVDLVKTDLTFSLASLGLIEKLTLTGSSNINATGNDLDNFLTGNSGANQLFGGLFADTLDGSGGADTLKGGHGNDTYIVDDVGDIVDEEGNISLNDTLQSSNVNLLAITLDIENYTYTGTADWTFTGDGNGNKITGGSGNDVLSGAQGGDTLIGGEGDDILYGDGPDDWLFGGAGRDVFLYDGTFDSFDLIWDFQLGASGDVLDLHAFLDNFSIPDDPFSGGHLSFIASGSNTLVRVDADGPGGPGSQFQLVTLLNVTLTVANTDNYIV